MSDKNEKYLRTIKTTLILLLIITLLVISKVSGPVTIRIMMSFFIFLLVLPLVTALEKAKFPSWLATIIAVLVIIVVVLFFVWFVFFSVDMLIQKVPSYSARLAEIDGLLKSVSKRWVQIPEDVSFFSFLKIDWVGNIIMPTLRSVSSSAIGIMSSGLIIILMTVFLLGERHVIIPKMMSFIHESDEDKVPIIWDRIVRQVSRYMSIKILISVVTGAVFYLIAIISGLDFALLWGVMAVVLNFIPTIGSILITALMILMSIIQFAPSFGPIVFVAVGTILTQNIIGNFLDPRLSGNSLNLSPFIILAALGLFGFIWGVVGMFLAVPLLSVVQIICANIDSARPIAILISSGRSYRKSLKARSERKHSARKQQNASRYDDVMFPDRQ